MSSRPRTYQPTPMYHVIPASQCAVDSPYMSQDSPYMPQAYMPQDNFYVPQSAPCCPMCGTNTSLGINAADYAAAGVVGMSAGLAGKTAYDGFEAARKMYLRQT